jgi:hypothetical protein
VDQQPVEAALDRQILAMFGNAIRSDSVERDVIERQFAMKSSTLDSWTTIITRTLERYSPPMTAMLEIRPSQNHWKEMVKKALKTSQKGGYEEVNDAAATIIFFRHCCIFYVQKAAI